MLSHHHSSTCICTHMHIHTHAHTQPPLFLTHTLHILAQSSHTFIAHHHHHAPSSSHTIITPHKSYAQFHHTGNSPPLHVPLLPYKTMMWWYLLLIVDSLHTRLSLMPHAAGSRCVCLGVCVWVFGCEFGCLWGGQGLHNS